MSKDVLLSLVRTLLTALGAFLFGKNILGTTLDANTWQTWIGAIIALGSTVWGIFDKSATIEGIQSGLRSFVIVAGGILVALGKLNGQTLEAILGIIAAVIPFLYSTLSKKKTALIAQGTLNPTSTGQIKKA